MAATREDWQKRLGPLYGGAVALVHSTPWRWPLELGDDARSPLWIVLLGLPVGLVAWAVAAIAHGAGLPPSLSAVIGLAALCLASAGLVERGLAECVDRWVRAGSGGYASTVAAPGMVSIPAALVLAFTVVVRAVALLTVSPDHWMWVFVATAVLGRWAAVFLQALGDPITETQSRSFVGVPAPAWLVAAISGGALALAVLALGKIGVVAMALAAICVFGLGILTQRKDGGLNPAAVAAAAAIGELFVLLVATMHRRTVLRFRQMSGKAKDRYDLVLLPGDGIGVEVMAHARALVELVASKTGAAFNLEEIPCGGKFFLENGKRDWPEGSEEKCQAADAILLGAVGWNGPDGAPVSMKMENGTTQMAGWRPVIGNRMKLDLYANVRPVKCLPGTKHTVSGAHKPVWSADKVDMVIIRENTEGLYSGIGERGEETATDLRVITRRASERVITKAFELSRERGKGAPADGKKRVTCITKHNVLQGCRFFLDVFREIAKKYPDVEPDVAIVDSFAMFVLTQPERYDVCVTTNMFGDILTDLASVLQGGMGMAVGCNMGDDRAMFEPIHGSAPPLAGKDKANPMAMMLATGEAFAWLGKRFSDERLHEAHAAIDAAVAELVAAGDPLTGDMGGTAGTNAVAKAILDGVRSRLS